MPKDPLSPEFDFETVMALMWNDPSGNLGYGLNARGPSTRTFGQDITDKFLKQHSLSLLIRSHEHKFFGHQYSHQSKCLTIFSCPDYQYASLINYLLFICLLFLHYHHIEV
jgi:diadenosine tetraphosphatase ApaH/serine/threonine PP2A family protein phosphatase